MRDNRLILEQLLVRWPSVEPETYHLPPRLRSNMEDADFERKAKPHVDHRGVVYKLAGPARGNDNGNHQNCNHPSNHHSRCVVVLCSVDGNVHGMQPRDYG